MKSSLDCMHIVNGKISWKWRKIRPSNERKSSSPLDSQLKVGVHVNLCMCLFARTEKCAVSRQAISIQWVRYSFLYCHDTSWRGIVWEKTGGTDNIKWGGLVIYEFMLSILKIGLRFVKILSPLWKIVMHRYRLEISETLQDCPVIALIYVGLSIRRLQ